MGFGGGGSGSFVLPNHDHTNVLADGGELLEATSLIDGVTLKAWLDAGLATIPTDVFELLDDHTAAGTESTYTFTPASALTATDYAAIRIIFTGRTSAALALQGVINGIVGAGNYSTGYRCDGTSLTNIAVIGASALQLASTSQLGVANASMNLIWDILFVKNDVGGFGGVSVNQNNNGPNAEYMNHLSVLASPTEITSINIKTSASTWKADCRINMYGIKRA